jgi:hypothetical protein
MKNIKPNAKDFDLQPYGYIHALQTYVDNIESNCLDRLKQQYKKYKQAEVDKNESLHYSFGITYRIERTFCLDCELISFNDIEVMENEVNQSF